MSAAASSELPGGEVPDGEVPDGEASTRRPLDRILLARRLFGAAGAALLVYGVAKLFLVVSLGDLFLLLLWMAGAVLVHDGLLSPLVLGVGAGLHRLLPDRGRRYVQGALITGAMLTVVALPMIYLEGSQPPAKAILLQDYGQNLTLVLALVAAVSLVLYALRVARDRRTAPAPSLAAEEDGPAD